MRLAGYRLAQGKGQGYNPVRKEYENTRHRWGLRLRGDFEVGSTDVQLNAQLEMQDHEPGFAGEPISVGVVVGG